MGIGNRLLNAILNLLTAIFNIPIRSKYVLLVLILSVGGSVWYTRHTMLNDVGGKAEYNEAMRYIEIKDVVDEQYIEEVNRETMGDNAAAAMISGLGDQWSYFMSPNEYKAYQLNSTNEYASIGMALAKLDNGGFEVISVNFDSPAALAGLTPGMVIVSVDDIDLSDKTLDEARVIIRSRLNTKFVLGIGNGRLQQLADRLTGSLGGVLQNRRGDIHRLVADEVENDLNFTRRNAHVSDLRFCLHDDSLLSAYFVLLEPAWPLKVRVGANSPSL